MCLVQYIQQIVLDAPYHYFVLGDVSLMRSCQKNQYVAGYYLRYGSCSEIKELTGVTGDCINVE